ncbi:hypothetical protein M8494_05250 [Serratia ureilytica]
MAVFLGIDVGGTVIKAGLYRASGEELAIAGGDGAAIAAQPGFSERNMDALWDDVCAASIRQTLHAAGLESRAGARRQLLGARQGAVRHRPPAVGNGILSSETTARRPAAELRRAGVDAQTCAQPAAAVAQPPGAAAALAKRRQPAQYAADRIPDGTRPARFRLTGGRRPKVTSISSSNLLLSTAALTIRR